MAKKLDAFLYVCLFVAIYWFSQVVVNSFLPFIDTFKLYLNGEKIAAFLAENFSENIGRGGIIETAAAWILTLIFVWIIFAIRKKRFFAALKTKRIYIKDIAGAVFVAIGLQAIASLVMIIPFPAWLFEVYDKHMAYTVYGGAVTVFIISGFIAPVFEEIFFRGVIYDEFSRGGGWFFSNFMQSLVFGVLHLNIVQGLYAFVIGFTLGGAMKAGKSIYVPIIAHIVFNVISLIFGNFIENVSADPYFIICGIFSLVMGFLLLKRK